MDRLLLTIRGRVCGTLIRLTLGVSVISSTLGCPRSITMGGVFIRVLGTFGSGPRMGFVIIMLGLRTLGLGCRMTVMLLLAGFLGMTLVLLLLGICICLRIVLVFGLGFFRFLAPRLLVFLVFGIAFFASQLIRVTLGFLALALSFMYGGNCCVLRPWYSRNVSRNRKNSPRYCARNV